ncbi:putative sugar nucleotidyl transferase [Arachidicoccus sp.]|uniref:putative sugar nucleotidyl transferase n=1 Tax=Arachidicoccus sp. TaxID=1872624 RepID=UPI003D218378
MAIILLETNTQREKFYPLSFIRPIAELQLGIFSLKDWWGKITGEQVFLLTEEYLQLSYPLPENELVYFINATLLPNKNIWDEIRSLKENESLKGPENRRLATRTYLNKNDRSVFLAAHLSEKTTIVNYNFVEYPYQLLRNHAQAINDQFELIAKEKPSQKISSTNNLIGAENIFLEEGVQMEYATLNALEGKIYIGKNALVMEGSLVRGALALGESSVVKMGSKIYGATSTGKKCVVGGEIKNSIFNHFGNKAHDGYLGDSIVGRCCNFGAGTTNSNVKNTAGDVAIYDYSTKNFSKLGKKMGLLLGDYSRLAINSSINTGSSIGVCCNVFGKDILPKLIPNFCWGIAGGGNIYQFDKAVQHIRNWMAFKNEILDEKEIQNLRHIFENPAT